MIFYSKEGLDNWQPNLIMLDLEDDLGHLYITRNTYDQAILLSDRFNHSTELIMQKLGCTTTQEDVASYMVAILPSPINILTPFYHLIDSDVQLDVDNIKQVIGVLSYMSMSLDFNTMLKVPYEVRANLVFTKSILLDYQGHFEDFNFRISDNVRHIVHEEKIVVRNPRSEREEFILEEKVEEGVIDLENFFDDIGWNDIEIPKISEINESNDVKEVTTDVQKEVISESDIYSAIANRYS